MNVCNVPGCPVLAKPGCQTCTIHATATTAKSLGIASTASGAVEHHCVKCRRAFKPDDYVRLKTLPTTVRRKPVLGHQHVSCEVRPPKRSRKKLREAEKPLWSGLEP